MYFNEITKGAATLLLCGLAVIVALTKVRKLVKLLIFVVIIAVAITVYTLGISNIIELLNFQS